jgi:hypothetical protein
VACLDLWYTLTKFIFSEDKTSKNSAPIYHVSLHEIGHILELPHNPDKNSVMYYLLIRMHDWVPDIDRKLAQKKWGIANKTSKRKQRTTPSIDTIPVASTFEFTKVTVFVIIMTFIFIIMLILSVYANYKTENTVISI